MKRLLQVLAVVCLALPVWAQNLTTVSGSNIQNLNGSKLAAGQICFLGTDNQNNPISFQAGGGGQVTRRAYCSPVTAGVITSFTVPNPANTLPSGIYYHVTVKDTSTGLPVIDYTGVTFSGTTFNFDTYTPVLSGASFAPLTGTTVSGNLGVTGNISATGTVAGSNIPANIPGVGACTDQFVTALNTAALPTCSTSLPAFNISTRGDRQIILQNPDFEGSTTIPPPGWLVSGSATLSYETVSPAPGKTQSIKVATTAQFGGLQALTLYSVVPGDVYSVQFLAKAGAATASAACDFQMQDKNGVDLLDIAAGTSSTTWTSVSTTGTAPANVMKAILNCNNSSATQPGTVWFDQIVVRKLDFPLIITSQLKGPEAAAPAGVANFDLLYADSTAHRWKMINNNGTAAQVVASGADINTSDQVTATHLAAALPIAQGGTGQATAAAAFNALNPMTTLGDMIYESGANTAAALAGNITTTKKYLSQTGTGTVSAAPAWAQIAFPDISGLIAASQLPSTPGKQIFTASGTFTIPTGVTAVKVTIVGGGGAGGGATAVNNGGGGGAGGSAIKWLTGLTPGNTITVTVGAGGTGVSGAGGNNGAASSIASGTQVITTVTANGGTGGPSTGAISAGGPGAAISTNGDINNGGGGGGYSNGGTGGGHGGASMFGGGPQGAFSAAGVSATVFGAGGAGGGVNACGNGANGVVIFEWTN